MRRILTIITTVVFLSTPALCLSAYRIHLKDGREFTTDRYWEDGEQIKFERFGGVLGISKDRVYSIKELDPAAETEAPQRPTQPVKQEKENAADKEKKKEKKEKNDLQPFIEKKKILKKKVDDALSRLRNASKNRDEAAKAKARKEMRAYSKELYALTEKVKEMNNGKLPEGWWED